MAETGTATRNSGGATQALAVIERTRAVVMRMPPARRGVLAACVAGVIALCAAGWWWSSRVEWKPLYSGLESRDATQVEGELAAAGIPYQTSVDGSGVNVPAEQIDKARLAVATKGTPASGRMGFELFDKPNWVGSEFDEKVNYQRALEGELEHTIASLAAVRSARVHLVLPRDTMFAAEQQPAKASVVLKLRKATLGRAEVEAVRQLVAGAVEGLSPDNVTLVDADGRSDLSGTLASSPEGDERAAMERRLVEILEPLAGTGNVRATVTLDREAAATDRVDETVDPKGTVPLSTVRRQEQTGAPRTASGVPGTVSNTAGPSVTGSAVAAAGTPPLLQPPVYPGSGAATSTASDEQSTFAVSRHTVHSQTLPGRITRVSAAVVVNDRESGAAGGEARTVWKPRTPDEMKRFEELAQAAVGFDAARGDKVAVENIAFQDNVPAVKPGTWPALEEKLTQLLRAQPGLLKTAGGLVLAAMLLLGVVRPAGRQAAAILREQAALPAPGMMIALSENAVVASPMDAASSQPLAVGGGKELHLQAPPRRAGSTIDDEGVFEYVTDHLRREPKKGADLLGAWIGTHDEVKL